MEVADTEVIPPPASYLPPHMEEEEAGVAGVAGVMEGLQPLAPLDADPDNDMDDIYEVVENIEGLDGPPGEGGAGAGMPDNSQLRGKLLPWLLDLEMPTYDFFFSFAIEFSFLN